MTTRPLGPPRGILLPTPAEGAFAHARVAPTADLARFVAHHWTVAWDLRGREPHVQKTLPHPCAHLVIEEGRSEIVGVLTTIFERTLEGRGVVFATKFTPGGFHPFARVPLVDLTDRRIPLNEMFGADGVALERAVLEAPDDAARFARLEEFLRTRERAPDDGLDTVAEIVALAERDRTILRVEDVTSRLGVTPRTVQRLFRRFVGVGLKWVIRRYRLLEALERIDAGGDIDWPALAIDLGYFDQAHFIKDWKSLIGEPPTQYRARASERPRPR